MKGDYKKISLPKPLINVKSLDMSFSGLKTAVLNCNYEIDKNNISRCDLAASFQKSVADVLCKKISLAIDISNKKFSNFKNVVVAGGVAANNYLREKIIENIKLKNKLAFFPPTHLCTDNGAMIAWAGYELYNAGVRSKLNIKAKPRWPLESIGERV
jgi:N6-L-threonylcarbamoyladenine synthase